MKSLSQLKHNLIAQVSPQEDTVELDEAEQLDEAGKKYYYDPINGDRTPKGKLGMLPSQKKKKKPTKQELQHKADMKTYNRIKGQSGSIKADKWWRERHPLEEEEQLDEIAVHNQAWSLPTVLVLRRKTIRNFSDGTKVALYYNERLDKYFTIPVRDDAPDQDPIAVSEGTIIDELKEFLDSIDEARTLTLESGEEITPIREAAQKLVNVYESLTEDNQAAFIETLSTAENFAKTLQFVCQYT